MQTVTGGGQGRGRRQRWSWRRPGYGGR